MQRFAEIRLCAYRDLIYLRKNSKLFYVDDDKLRIKFEYVK